MKRSTASRAEPAPCFAARCGFRKVGRAYERTFDQYTWRIFSLGGDWQVALERDGETIKTLPARGLAAGVRLAEFLQAGITL